MQIEYKYECTLSILIENQPSILPRIVGLLTRRGFKVDSLAIGSTEYDQTSRLIIILPGNMRVIDQITRQLYKLLPIIKIQNLTHFPSIRRELLLLKILSTRKDRSKILEIATFFRAKILDFAERVLTIEVTGDSEKIIALEQLINQFGVLELVRTGKIALSRESIINAQLFTKQKNVNRKKILNSYISEVETKLYLK
uniref:Acetolactate synthase small subunit n=1 Tax=Coscinodiscus wailesii TaxID=671091 RepID=A0A8A6KGV6_9STRA|nr:acetohydroxyacid synthetase small subunit [Coscinodiscus wailesii]QTI82807.1 acetohydroxyacid synthetase small subunit [Coscinodiscus wailesii]